jgi:putative DNA methylase
LRGWSQRPELKGIETPDRYSDTSQRDLPVELAGYLASQLETLRPDEANAARVLPELVGNQRVG